MYKKMIHLALAAVLALGCGDGATDPVGTGGATVATGGLTGAGGSTLVTGGSFSGGHSAGGMPTGGNGTGNVSSGGANVGGSGLGGDQQQAGGMGTGVGGAGDTGGSTSGGMGTGGGSPQMEWLPSWATSIQQSEPNNTPASMENKTVRQFIWPTVSGDEIRIQLSNEKGSAPVEIQSVHIARAKTAGDPGNSNGQIDTATDKAFTFSGMEAVTIPQGETVWSDGLAFSLEEIKLTSVTMKLGSVPSDITGHPGSRTTTYVGSGETSDESLSATETWPRWYFINALSVMAPADSYAIAVLGDSITDGYGTLDAFQRWPDFLTLSIQDDPMIADNRSVLNFGMGANNLTKDDTYQDAGVKRFERDVLTRDKIKWLIVLEGINDIEYSNIQAPAIIQAYQTIIQKAHDKGILVYGSPITPNEAAGERAIVNEWVRTSGEFDAIIDLDEVLRDPNNTNNTLPAYREDTLHPNAAGYEAMGRSVDLSLFYNLAP